MKKKLLLLTMIAIFLPGMVIAEQLVYRSDYAIGTVRGADSWEQGLWFTTGATAPDVAALGFIDLENTGGAGDGDGLQEAHTVNLWLVSDGSLVASVEVPAGTGGLLDDGYRWITIAGGTITLAADTEYVVSSDTTDMLDSWLDAETVTLDPYFIGTNDSTTYGPSWSGAGISPGVNTGWTGDCYGLVNISSIAGAASGPVPTDGSTVDASTTTQLSWTYPNPVGTLTSEVYLGDPNISSAVLLTDAVNTDNVVSVSLTAGHSYEWRVDVTDSGTAKTTTGSVWSFDTVNSAPVVDAGYNQSGWISGSTAAVTLTGTVTDDVLPTTTETYTWSKISGPGSMSPPTPSGTVPVGGIVSAAVTFNAAGTYVVQLEGDDSSLQGTDTVKVYVYAEANDGNLIAHWPFDTNMNDTSGNSHHGSAMGDAQIDASAKVGAGSVLLDGVGDYVDCGGGGDPNFATWASPETSTGSGVYSETMTVTCWVKTAGADGWAGLVTKGDAWSLEDNGYDDGDDPWLRVNGEDSTNDEDSTVSSGGAGSGAIKSIEDDKWHHIAAVNVGNVLHIYIDGILAESSGVDEGSWGGHDLWIGKAFWAGYSGTPYEFAGNIDDVKLFQAPLSAAKVFEEFIDAGGYNSCGGNYAPTDVNQDCYTDLDDFIDVFVGMWMSCSDVTNPACN